MTVREAFSADYGPVSVVATCHVGFWWGPDHNSPFTLGPTIRDPGEAEGWPECWDDITERWSASMALEFPLGPDISDRPASSFLGFFGEAYDQIVEASL